MDSFFLSWWKRSSLLLSSLTLNRFIYNCVDIHKLWSIKWSKNKNDHIIRTSEENIINNMLNSKNNRSATRKNEKFTIALELYFLARIFSSFVGIIIGLEWLKQLILIINVFIAQTAHFVRIIFMLVIIWWEWWWWQWVNRWHYIWNERIFSFPSNKKDKIQCNKASTKDNEHEHSCRVTSVWAVWIWNFEIFIWNSMLWHFSNFLRRKKYCTISSCCFSFSLCVSVD